MKFLILFIIAMVISSIGFKKFVWFISIGYGFSVAGIGATLIYYSISEGFNVVPFIMSVLFVVYGCRLGGYLMLREIKSASYQATMKNDIKDGSGMNFLYKIIIWATCALLYVCETCPVLFRIENCIADDVSGVIGMILMACGILLEGASDFVKNRYKKENPNRFCDVYMFKVVRCPNYFGEVLTWTGVFVSGISVYQNVLQWIAAIFGWVCIVYIMFGGARRLELRQNKNYGGNPEYQVYVKKVPILIPLIPLYSVAKYKWLVG